ncbi:MAG TPA: hypothetical protein VG370_05650 [Chloroflexota bacterium]|nr:hypothetical protein [Chloroflexota bacterium]
MPAPLSRSRARPLADLAAARAVLLRPPVGLAEPALVGRPVVAGWTAKDLLAAIEPMTQADRARPFVNPFGGGRTLYVWLRIWQIHDHEHAEGVRTALGGSPV